MCYSAQALTFSISRSGLSPTGAMLRRVTPAALYASIRSRTKPSSPTIDVAARYSSGTAASASAVTADSEVVAVGR